MARFVSHALRASAEGVGSLEYVIRTASTGKRPTLTKEECAQRVRAFVAVLGAIDGGGGPRAAFMAACKRAGGSGGGPSDDEVDAFRRAVRAAMDAVVFDVDGDVLYKLGAHQKALFSLLRWFASVGDRFKTLRDKGPLGVSVADMRALVAAHPFPSQRQFVNARLGFSLAGREWPEAKAVARGGCGEDAFAHQDVFVPGVTSSVDQQQQPPGTSITVESFVNPLKVKSVRVIVADKTPRDERMAVPNVGVIVYEILHALKLVVDGVLKLRQRRLSLRDVRADAKTLGCMNTRQMILTHALTYLCRVIHLTRVCRGVEMCALCLDHLYLPGGTGGRGPLALAALDASLLVSASSYVEVAYKGKDMKRFFTLTHDVLPAHMTMLSVPHALAFVVRLVLALDPGRLDPAPNLNPGLRIFTLRDHKGRLLQAKTDHLSDWLQRTHAARAPLRTLHGTPVGGIQYKGFTTYAYRYTWAVEMVLLKLDEHSPLAADFMRLAFGHGPSSNTAKYIYGTNVSRAVLTDVVGVAVQKLTLPLEGDGDGDGGCRLPNQPSALSVAGVAMRDMYASLLRSKFATMKAI